MPQSLALGLAQSLRAQRRQVQAPVQPLPVLWRVQVQLTRQARCWPARAQAQLLPARVQVWAMRWWLRVLVQLLVREL